MVNLIWLPLTIWLARAGFNWLDLGAAGALACPAWVDLAVLVALARPGKLDLMANESPIDSMSKKNND